jgi:hypothetical protein
MLLRNDRHDPTLWLNRRVFLHRLNIAEDCAAVERKLLAVAFELVVAIPACEGEFGGLESVHKGSLDRTLGHPRLTHG